MAKKEFILQGFTNRTHLAAIRELFDVADIQRVILSVAFVSESGVELLKTQIADCAAHVVVYAGIRNDITSRQGLERLLDFGVKLYAVDTGSRIVLFHPKLYLIRGKSHARLIVGSANLTLGGLNNNVEAGVAFDFNLADTGDKALVDEIEARFNALPTEYPDHVLNISSTAQLEEMQASGRLMDETAIPPPQLKLPSGSTGAGTSDAVPRIKLKIPRIYRAIAKAGALSKKSAAPVPPSPTGVPPGVTLASAVAAYEPVWRSKPLSRRSLTIPTGTKSNPTGSTTLGKGLLNNIDPVTYFRKDVFGHLPWQKYTNRAGNIAERVEAKFDLILKGALERFMF